MAQERLNSSDTKRQSTENFNLPNISETISRAQKATGKISVTYGANQEYYDLSGKTVGQVRKSLREAFSLPGDAVAYVGNQEVEDDYVLQSGQNLEFSKESGTKGII